MCSTTRSYCSGFRRVSGLAISCWKGFTRTYLVEFNTFVVDLRSRRSFSKPGTFQNGPFWHRYCASLTWQRWTKVIACCRINMLMILRFLVLLAFSQNYLSVWTMLLAGCNPARAMAVAHQLVYLPILSIDCSRFRMRQGDLSFGFTALTTLLMLSFTFIGYMCLSELRTRLLRWRIKRCVVSLLATFASLKFHIGRTFSLHPLTVWSFLL